MIVKIGNKLKKFEISLFDSVVNIWIFEGGVPQFEYLYTATSENKLEKIVVPDEYYDNWKNSPELSQWASFIIKASEYNGKESW